MADERGAFRHHGFEQGEPFTVVHDVAQAFVISAVVVARFGGGGKPAFIDAAAMRTERVIIIRMKLETLPGK